MSIGTNIYSASNGRFSYGNFDGNDAMTNAAQAIGQTVVNETKQQENTVHESYMRAQKVSAVTGLVIGDFGAAVQSRAYDNMLNTTGNNFDSMMASLQYSPNATAQAVQYINQFSFTDTSQGISTIHNPGSISLSQRDIESIALTGQFTKTEGGQQHVYSINQPAGVTLAEQKQILSNHVYNGEQYNRIANAQSSKEKVDAIMELRSASIAQLKKSGVDIGNGTTCAIERKRQELTNNINIANANGNVARVATLQKQLDALNKHEQIFGTNDNTPKNKSYGKRVLQEYMLGEDINLGVRKTQQISQVAVTTARLATRANASVSYKLSEKFLSNRQINVFGHTINGNDIVADRQKIRDQYKKESQLKGKARKDEHKRFKNERRSQRNIKKETRVKQRASTLRKNGQSERAQRLLNKYNARRTRVDNITKFSNDISHGFQRVKDIINAPKIWLKNKIQNSTIGQFVFNRILDPLNNLKRFLLGQIKKYIIVPLGQLLLFILFVGAIMTVITYSLNFMSEIATKLANVGHNVNYVQVIVDETADTMGDGFITAAKRDASEHFLDIDAGTAVDSPKYEWKKGVNEGEIRYIYTEDMEEVASPNSNLMQLTSLMHRRMYDSIDYKHYYTAKAYMYYMYVHTHDVYGYDYDDADDHPDTDIFSNGVTYSYDNTKAVGARLTRPAKEDELCENIYYHGYDVEINKKINELRMRADKWISVTVSTLLSETGETLVANAVDETKSGVFIDQKPFDAKSVCEDAIAYKRGTIEGESNNPADNKAIDNNCGYLQHVHTYSCYTKNCHHSHGGCGASEGHCNHSCGGHPTGGTTSDSSIGCWDVTCGKRGHSHTEWQSASNPGCWKTAYVCPGHCGGHITPQIDVTIDYDWPALMQEDYFKMTFWLDATDFPDTIVHEILEDATIKTIDAWKTKWNLHMAKWFFPFPTPYDIAAKWTQFCIQGGMTILNKIGEFFGGQTEANIIENIEEDVGVDILAFEGYLDEDGIPKKDEIEYLESFYGVIDNDFKDGYQAWEDFDVVFPMGETRPMTAAQKSAVSAQITARYPNLSESRWAVINQAMDYVGKFWYDLSTKTGTAASTSGRIDCSGFVSSVLRHAGIAGWDTLDWTASGFACAGTNYGGNVYNLQPGDIIAMNRTASWSGSGGWGSGGTNHVMIFIGYLPEGVKGYPESQENAYYVIDCSSSKGGSMIRPFSDFSKYPYVYRPY